MKKLLLLSSLILLSTLLLSLTIDDIRFCLDHEFFYILEKSPEQISLLAQSDSLSSEDIAVLQEYAIRLENQYILEQLLLRNARTDGDIESALAWVKLKRSTLEKPDFSIDPQEAEADYLRRVRELYSVNAEYNLVVESLGRIYTQPADSLLLYLAVNDTTNAITETKLRQFLPGLFTYNQVIEDFAKSRIDDIGIERNDSLALAMIDRFYLDYPHSRWHQAAYYYQLYHLRNNGDNNTVLQQINSYHLRSPEHSFISSIFLASPTFRKALPNRDYNRVLLETGIQVLKSLQTESRGSFQLLYTVYDQDQWQNKLRLQIAKLGYYKILDKYSCFGDEDSLFFRVEPDNTELQELISLLMDIRFPNNLNGELAELHFWLGKAMSLVNDETRIEEMVSHFAKSLILGSPRSSTKEESERYISDLHRISKVKTDPLSWIRSILGYQGPRFRDRTDESGLAGTRYSRVAVGDYNNDGWHDLLLSGNKIYTNRGDGSFVPREDDTFSTYPSAGGLWADFNRDGLLDFMTLSHDELMGEQLMKQMPDSSFVSVNERAGDIANYCPTEGAAWIDPELTGYPSLYLANYEKWQQQSGYSDNFWHNERGYFTELSQELGFLTPPYTHDPGLAGRGVAPADFDNDGTQDLLVTNYRLTRNFFWKRSGERYVDIAALSGVQGSWSDGYYGHSIGADWGDYDNDGDLDLLVANLAHPRFLDFSDISSLYRNEGMSYRVIEADTLHYWQFTDVTQDAGINYDELHSDPLWIDVDNDGDLDLFISCIYENARSYLYENKGDGSFEDVTWLSGADVYNGWGNAMGDFNRDGLADIICGSGSGTKLLINESLSGYSSLWIKPVWSDDQIHTSTNYQEHSSLPNSPAFGARYQITVESPEGLRTSLIRELSGGKGTSSQSAQELHFGLGSNRLIDFKRWLALPEER